MKRGKAKKKLKNRWKNLQLQPEKSIIEQINGRKRPHSPQGEAESYSPPPIVLGSRKRVRSNVEFVYPKDSSNSSKLYVFEKRRKAKPGSQTENKASPDESHSSQSLLEHSNKPNVTPESIDDILFPRSALKPPQEVRRQHEIANSSTEFESNKEHVDAPSISVEEQRRDMPMAQDIEATYCYEKERGRLSGLSVEDAVRDKVGCRPRSNSTDGELNLPRRGLCDERIVLEAHRWRNPMGRAAPKGFMNLGNTCFLNATLQCLAYLPTFSQTLISLPLKNGVKMSKGQRITTVLCSLFRQVHGVDGVHSDRDSLSPGGIVKALPSLGSGGQRSGYKFRPGRQEDAHEFLVHLLDAMHDGELKAAGKDIDEKIATCSMSVQSDLLYFTLQRRTRNQPACKWLARPSSDSTT
jgi:Ubiquitin carboxyl-terminal hydrolase